MGEKVNSKKFSSTILRNSILFLVLFFVVIVFAVYFLLREYKVSILESASANYTANIKYYNQLVKNELLLNNKLKVFELSDEIKSNKFIKNIEIKYERFIFNKNTLLANTPSFNDKSWEIGNIEVDIKYGFINKLDKSDLFEFIPSGEFNISDDLLLRYQAYKNGKIQNFITSLNFETNISKNDKIMFENVPEWFSSYISLSIDNSLNILNISNISFGSTNYEFDNRVINYELYLLFIKVITFTFIIFTPFFLFILFYQKMVHNKYVTKPIHFLNKFVDNILEHRFSKINNSDFEDTKDFKQLITKVSKVSTKMASLVNELNINKESLERKMSTDNLTGLANQKIFELDMKAMFVSSTKGYVFSIKLDNLAKITENIGSVGTNNFIQSFVNNINNSIRNFKKNDLRFYRFYGSEFVLIAKKIDSKTANLISQTIVDNLKKEIFESFTLPENIINIGATPFNIYGTTDSILNSAMTLALESKKKSLNSFIVLDEAKLESDNELLENSILRIIGNNEFNIELLYDTYLFEDKRLFMKELRPVLRDNRNNKIEIGSFISIAEKLHKVYIFDLSVIKKSLEYIAQNNINYKIAINLSIQSISNLKFLLEIEKLVNENSFLKSHIVFSITSYTASLHKNEFENFVNKMNNLNIEVLIKRYQTKEYPLEELAKINISYLRMNKIYTSNISNELVKKHNVKNIIIFGELNNVKVMADNVESDLDYALLDRLDLYATSK